MCLKTIFVLSACLALALGAVIELRAKRQINSSSKKSELPSFSDSFGSGSESNFDSTNLTSSGASSIGGGFQNAGKRLQNAFNETYQDERNSVSDSYNSVKDRFHQDIETAGNLTKTAFDLGTILPKFGKNVIISDSN
ncbi:uncharacterized protein LOC131669906 [Phymastichus coffea]|uniref:uncharacterized protein LOC131669906 n=1 Tax=Phymastichus coffea TaxID=108790 RepID=UPI00273A7643|nr:uncharacterized protein LOC131669906 [Phymastichus coffea]